MHACQWKRSTFSGALWVLTRGNLDFIVGGGPLCLSRQLAGYQGDSWWIVLGNKDWQLEIKVFINECISLLIPPIVFALVQIFLRGITDLWNFFLYHGFPRLNVAKADESHTVNLLLKRVVLIPTGGCLPFIWTRTSYGLTCPAGKVGLSYWYVYLAVPHQCQLCSAPNPPPHPSLQQTQNRMKLMADNYEDDHLKASSHSDQTNHKPSPDQVRAQLTNCIARFRKGSLAYTHSWYVTCLPFTLFSSFTSFSLAFPSFLRILSVRFCAALYIYFISKGHVLILNVYNYYSQGYTTGNSIFCNL